MRYQGGKSRIAQHIAQIITTEREIDRAINVY